MTGESGARGDGRAGSEATYVFNNAGGQAPGRFRALEQIFDPGTKRLLIDIGVEQGWSCLEVGAGSGSVATWLAERVGPGGEVVATDIDTRHLEQMRAPNMTVISHDVARNSLPECRFDLVHTRLVLIHLRDREQIISKLISALRPGGYLLLEEFDSMSLRPDPAVNPAESDLPTIRAMYRLMAQRGVELRCGRFLDSWLRQCTLMEVASEGRLFTWRSGSLGAQLLRLNIEQLRNDMIAEGMISDAQLQADLACLAEGDAAFPSPILWAAWGRKHFG